MADQERRYITRARARATDGTITTSKPTDTASARFASTRRVPEKRKALADPTAPRTENLAGTTAAARTTRAAKKPATTTTQTSGLTAAPVRRSTRAGRPASGGPASRPIAPSRAKITTTMKSSKKKVTFASPAAEDKENSPPKPVSTEDTDMFMSESLGALSVKPKRTRQSKIKPPTGSLMGPIPELSPLKARRMPKIAKDDSDNIMEDIFNAPMSPGLSARPHRVVPFGLSTKKNAMDGAGLLQNNPLKSSTLYGSPARRPPTSPKKAPTELTTASLVKPSGLSSPAKRSVCASRLASPTKKTGTTTGAASSLKFCITMDNEDPFRESDLSEDELSLPARPVDRKLFSRTTDNTKHTPIAQNDPFADMFDGGKEIKSERAEDGMDDETMDRKIAGLVASFATTPPSPTDARSALSPVSPTPVRQGLSVAAFDQDSDVFMDEDSENVSPTKHLPSTSIKKHKSPREGGSSYGFFDMEEDDDEEEAHGENDENSENVAPRGMTTIPVFGGAEIERQRKDRSRGFGQVLDDRATASAKSQVFEDIPIDPMLASDDIVIGYSEISSCTTVPIKMHSIDDEEMEDEEENSENTPCSPRKRRSSGLIAPAGVLAGAVIYLDVHTTDGADASSCFCDMLKNLGARVLKNWTWNPSSASDKIGITHVIFKEGSPRTLQKVKQAKGIVRCVGLSWVMACAENQRWMEEDGHFVDLDNVPRGGGRRRKSMEPKALEKATGTPVPHTPSKPLTYAKPPRTEPPKMIMLTPGMRQRVLDVRRKSMQFAPKVGSPLRGGWTMEG